ncbi:MAG: hypothetical protein JO055_18585 [Alphaproteobacteria bacterium]|nr:hypothetical protein [Alphaproteobacteria bacterium]
MAQSAVILLENARKARTEATRARRLAMAVSDGQAMRTLHAYANELEQRAREYERLATDLAATVSRTKKLTREIGEAMQQLQQTVDGIRKPRKTE